MGMAGTTKAWVLRLLITAFVVCGASGPGRAQSSADTPDKLTVATIERPPFSVEAD